jgi:carboxyl-terminal processing protease
MARVDLRNIVFAITAVALTAACGGGGSSSGGNGVPIGSAPPASVTPPTPPTTAACSVRSRQDWALGVLNEWYLFPETLPAALDPSSFTTVDAYVDALTATARSQGRDRNFSGITSIAEENAFFTSGATAGFGIRLSYDSPARRLFVAESFEGAPALAAGIDRGAEIISIGTTASNLRLVTDLFNAGGAGAVSEALGPSTAGTSRVLRIVDSAGTRNVTIVKTDFDLTPLSSRYGSRIIDDGGKKVGYLNMRTFISTADPQLRTAFDNFRAQGVTEFIIDFRYNGGGLLNTAYLMNDLLGGNRTTSQVQAFVAFRPSKSSENETRFFQPQPQSVSPVRIAFIGTGGTASASELVMNSFVPYLGVNAALVGSNTFGKPVGQIAIDRAACDDRFRVVALAIQNSARNGAYFNGLAGTMGATCRAADDITKPLGDPQEASVRTALDYLAGRTCTPISASASKNTAQRAIERELMTPDAPTTAQEQTPGLF